MVRVRKDDFKEVLEKYAGYIARGEYEKMFDDMLSQTKVDYSYTVYYAIYNILEKRNKISKYLTKVPKFGLAGDDLTGTSTITIPAHWDLSRLGKNIAINDGHIHCEISAETVIFEPDCKLLPGTDISRICDPRSLVNLILPKHCERLQGISELGNIEYIYIPKGFKGRFSVGNKAFYSSGENLHIGMQKETVADIQVREEELDWFKKHVIILDEGEIMP